MSTPCPPSLCRQVCDLRLWRSGDPEKMREFATRLGSSLRTIGFAVLVHHGVDEELARAAPGRIERFFTAHSNEVKQRFAASRHGSVNQGFFDLLETSNLQPDLVEGWVFTRRGFAMDGRDAATVAGLWPDPVNDEPWFRRFVEAHLELVAPVTHAILAYLGADSHALDRVLRIGSPAHGNGGNGGDGDAERCRCNFGLRLNYYPPIRGTEPAGAGRMLGHEDMDLFTLLPKPSQDGLQVLNRATGKWIRLKPPQGAIILNSGDYLQRITADVLPSTTHRVAAPKATDPLARVARTSSPIAVYVPEQEMLRCVVGQGLQGDGAGGGGSSAAVTSYPPIKAIDFHTAVMAKYYGDDYRAANGVDSNGGYEVAALTAVVQ